MQTTKTGNVNLKKEQCDKCQMLGPIGPCDECFNNLLVIKSAHINRGTKQGEIVIEVEDEKIYEAAKAAIEIGSKITPELTANEEAFFIAGFQECIKWQKSQQPTSVKASERLPPLDQEIFVTVDGRKCVGKFYEGGKSFSYRNFSNFGNIVEGDFDRIEWLDETTRSTLPL
jgi:hypothetical protein